ncbi:GntR family transcriptional regulator [Microbacterium sp. NPDC089696]|uniref:GntR family transcriptional regulator n=1 Tax=Microbacterium sp. NPDC089696 TaxID=3364199 RepID=UPI00382E94A1
MADISDGAPKSRLTVAEIHAALKEQIMFAAIEPGARIKIDAIARDLGVSPTPVREALQRLESDNLVDSSPGRGYSTTPLLDAGGLRDLYEFRLLLEPWAARSAAVARLANPARHLRSLIDDLKVALEGNGDRRRELLAHDTAFHNAIIEAANNGVMTQAYEHTHCHLHIYRLQPDDVHVDVTLEEHAALATAIEVSDPTAAEAAMRAHLENSFTRYSRG